MKNGKISMNICEMSDQLRQIALAMKIVARMDNIGKDKTLVRIETISRKIMLE